MKKKSKNIKPFEEALTDLINQYNIMGITNTNIPTFVLAQYLHDCLKALSKFQGWVKTK